MNTWYYGYADMNGLGTIKEFIPNVPDKEKNAHIWDLSSKTKKETLGVVFEFSLPSEKSGEIFTLDPINSMLFIDKESIELSIATFPILEDTHAERWSKLIEYCKLKNK